MTTESASVLRTTSATTTDPVVTLADCTLKTTWASWPLAAGWSTGLSLLATPLARSKEASARRSGVNSQRPLARWLRESSGS